MFNRKGFAFSFTIFAAVLVLVVGFLPSPSSALSGSDFQAGHIIDDAVFYAGTSMTSSQVQTFLNSKVPTCDTNGTTQKSYYYNSSTGQVNNGGSWVTTSRATYGKRYATWYNKHTYTGYITNESVAPYTCLKSYKQNTPAENAESGICGNLTAKTNRTAAQIITDVANACGVSPKVLLVLLQKEQGLVTDDWPWLNEYDQATGFGCPDSTGCESTYYGFFNQVYLAAKQFRLYRANPTNFNYVAGQNNHIPYNPNASCGTKTVFIQNQATAGLYDYTPYVPNSAALKNLSGTGDSCSAYGNRNFWVYYNEWFGTTMDSVSVSSELRFTPAFEEGAFTAESITLSFDLTNTTSSTQSVQVAIAARNSAGDNLDFPLKTISIKASSKATYSVSRVFDTEDTYTFWITSFHNNEWDDNYPESNNVVNARKITQYIQAMPTVTQQPTAADQLRQGKATTLSFAVKNNSTKSINLGEVGIAVRDPNNQNADVPFDTVSALAASTTYTYTKPFTPQKAGHYTLFISDSMDGGKTWDQTNFPAMASGLSRSISLTALPNPTITQQPTFSLASPHTGQSTSGSFVVHNYGDAAVDAGELALAIRGPGGSNYDMPLIQATIQSGQDFTYTASRSFPVAGTYTAWVTDYQNGKWNDTSYPAADSPSISRKITFTVLPNPTITQTPTLSIASPRVGQSATATFKVKNYSDSSVNIGNIGLAIRDPNNKNDDLSAVPVTLASGQEYTFSASRAFTVPGTYTAWITDYHAGKWDNTYPALDSGAIERKVTFTVLPSPTITQGPSLNVTTPQVGQNVMGTFTVHNYGDTAVNVGGLALAIRGPNKINEDMALKQVTIQPGQDYTYTDSKVFPVAGTYTAWVTDYQNGKWNDTSYPAADSPSVVRKITFTVSP